MKHSAKILSFVMVLMMALGVLGIFTMMPQEAYAASNTYKKVTSTDDITSGGTYLIVYESGNLIFNGSLTTLDAVNNYQKVTISDNQITGDYNVHAFTITKSESSYTIKSASGYYIGQTSNANGLKSSESTEYSNTISINSDGSINFVSGGAYLRFNAASNQNRFRYYKSSSYSGQKAICLYKLEEGCTHSWNEATCTAPKTCSICGEIDGSALEHSWNEATCTTPKTCSVCGATEGGLIDHDFGSDKICDVCGYEAPCLHENTTTETVDATCTEDGSVTTICNDCGYEEAEVLPASGHTLSVAVEENRKEATCSLAGSYDSVVYCSVCEKEVSRNTVTIPATNAHDYNSHGVCECGKTENHISINGYIEIDWANAKTGDVVYILCIAPNGNKYMLSNNKGTGNAPDAVEYTDGMDIPENCKWVVENNNGKFTFYKDSSKKAWLYCTNNNNGVRVGTNTNKTFVLDASGYLEHEETNRYLGVYLTNPDWRCYTNTTGNTVNQTFSVFAYTEKACENPEWTNGVCSCGYVADDHDGCWVDGICNVCGANADTSLDSASVTLQDNLLVNFKINKDKLDNVNLGTPVAVITFNGNEYEVEGAFVNGQYVFSFPIAPHQMNDEIKIYLVCENTENEEITYSVATYCMNKFNDAESSAELKALVASILNYGAAAQEAVGYNTGNLANSALPEENQKIGEVSADAVSSQGGEVAEPSAIWVSAGLVLQDKIVIRFAFEAESVEGLTVNAVVNGITYNYGVEKFVKVEGVDNRYYVYIEGLNATQLRDAVSVTVMNGNEAVSSTLSYSVAVYAAKVFAYAEVEGYENLVNLVKAMMAYGDAASAYIAK